MGEDVDKQGMQRSIETHENQLKCELTL